jgi:hypothetical protein
MTQQQQPTILNYTAQKLISVQYDDSPEAVHHFPSCGVARVEEQQTVMGRLGRYALRSVHYKEIVGLPEPQPETYLIVSIVVAQVNARLATPRKDLIYPDSGTSCTRDTESGQVVCVTGFLQL